MTGCTDDALTGDEAPGTDRGAARGVGRYDASPEMPEQRTLMERWR